MSLLDAWFAVAVPASFFGLAAAAEQIEKWWRRR